MINNSLQKQIAFLVEVDKLKEVYRRSVLMDKSRHENDAEHSWHLAMMALILSDYANEKNISLLHVVKMLLIHDIVEIDAGDTFCYDEKGYEDKAEREQKAADRIFGMLPEEQANEIHALWREFEKRETPEARFAAALDRLQPLLHNYFTEGYSWKKNNVTSDKVLQRNTIIAEGSEELWQYAKTLIEDAVEKGYLPEKTSD
jgi:putative hydrolase of HD superfamily